MRRRWCGTRGIKPPMSVRPGAAAQVCAYDELADPNSDCSAEVRRANTHYRPPFSSFFLHPTTLSLSLYSPPPPFSLATGLGVRLRYAAPGQLLRQQPSDFSMSVLPSVPKPGRRMGATGARVRSRGGSARSRSAACSRTCRC